MLLIVFFLSASGLLHAQTGVLQQPVVNAEKSSSIPKLADIIPRASELSGRLARLENDLQILSDLSAEKRELASYRAIADDAASRLDVIKRGEGNHRAKLISLEHKIQGELEFPRVLGRPLARKINILDGMKEEWQAEKKHWQDLSFSLHADQEPTQLTTTFATANETIDKALININQKLDDTLQIQVLAGEVNARLATLGADIRAMISAERRDSLVSLSPPMFSPDYFAQFESDLWQSTLENLQALSWPSRKYFAQHSWTLAAHLLLFITFILFVNNNKQSLRESERWNFLAARPVASALFVVALTNLSFSEEYQFFPITLKLIYTVIGGISFATIIRFITEKSLKGRAALSVIILFVVSIVLITIGIPDPLYRLFIFVTSLLALYYLSCLIRASVKQEESPWFIWLLRLACLMSLVIIFAQLFGKVGLANFLFESSFTSLVIILAFMFFVYMIRGGLRWVFFSPFVWNFKQLRSEAELLSRRSGYLIEALIVLFVLFPMILTTWGVYSSVQEATKGLINLGFDVGTLHISSGLILASVGTLYCSFILSWFLPKVLLDERLAGGGLERGVRISISRLIQYFIIFIGFLLTISVLGFDLTKLTIILSALGVGIGFGLQGIVNNFFSGLVLLFEQPVRVGDTVEISGKWAEIKRIGLRSTTVQTVEKADVIIPNADLISKDVTNWTLSNRQIRLSIPVGVAYGSDVPLVMEILLACSRENELIVKSPPAQVFFLGFGENSLDFKLLAWITDADYRLLVRSDLNQEIDRRFREAQVEIPFPQRDIHLRSIDKSIAVPSSIACDKE